MMMVRSVTRLVGVCGLCLSLMLQAATEESIRLVQSQYVAFYGRPGDMAGVLWWADTLEAEGGLDRIQEAFANSDEFRDRILPGDGTTIEALTPAERISLINNLYQNMFGRDGDDAGLAYWADQLSSGARTLIDIATAIGEGASPGGDDATIYANRVVLAQRMTEAMAEAGIVFQADDIPTVQSFLFSGIDDPSDDPSTVDLSPLIDSLTTASSGGHPVVYFVLHADPATGRELQSRWNRLVSFMNDLQERNAGLEVPHHVTVMFTAEWGKMLQREENEAMRDLVRQWIQEGHEFAFHSHTHNHTFRDGYTNASEFGDDFDSGDDRCSGDRTQGECTLDFGFQTVQAALDRISEGYRIQFAAIGPRGNGGTSLRWGKHDNSCNPAHDSQGQPIADETGCIDAEWSTYLDDNVPYVTLAYPQDEPLSATELLAESDCVRYGDSIRDIYGIPHAPFETESGQPQVTLSAFREAVNMGNGADFIGVVIHPVSYDGSNVEKVTEWFDFLDGKAADSPNTQGPFASVTLSEARTLDQQGRGVACLGSTE